METEALFSCPIILTYWTGQWELSNLDLHLPDPTDQYYCDVHHVYDYCHTPADEHVSLYGETASDVDRLVSDCEAFGHMGFKFCARCGEDLTPRLESQGLLGKFAKLGLLMLALSAGCAATVAPSAAELACDNYVDTLDCSPNPIGPNFLGTTNPMPASYTHADCMSGFVKLPEKELTCLAEIAKCSDAPTCISSPATASH